MFQPSQHIVHAQCHIQVLHMGRVKSAESKDPEAAEFFHQQRLQHGLYTTPPGSNDDWYWLYAAVKAGENGARGKGRAVGPNPAPLLGQGLDLEACFCVDKSLCIIIIIIK